MARLPWAFAGADCFCARGVVSTVTANLPDKPAPAGPKPERDPEGRMTFTAHLGELRVRMIRSIIAITVGVVICYIFSNEIIEALMDPITGLSAPPATDGSTSSPVTSSMAGQAVSLSPFEPFLVKMRISGYFGTALALPIIVYQICAFVFPGLTQTEKRVIRFMLVGGFFLAIAGISVAYFLILPAALQAMAHMAPSLVTQMLQLSATVSTIMKVLLGFALAFQMPMVVLALVYIGILTPAMLKAYRRVAIVGIFVAAAVFTPPDPISMLLMAIPMLALYEFSILISYLVIRQKVKAAATAGT